MITSIKNYTRWSILSLFLAVGLTLGCGDDDEDPFGTPEELSQNISSNLTLSPHEDSFPHYLVTDRINVTNGTLTILPGTVISFANEAGLVIQADGAIVAEGESDDMIEFVGEEDTAGFWRGIQIQSENPSNIMNHVRIAHAGGSRWFNSVDEAALLLNGGQLALENSVLENIEGAGIFIDANGSWINFENNRFDNLDSVAVITTPVNVGGLDADTDFNDFVVRVMGGNFEGDHTWANLNTYLEMRDITRLQSGTLTLEEGLELRFFNEAGLRIDSDASIVAQGSEENMIVMRGVDETEGLWRGVMIQSNNPLNEMSFVRIAHAGNGRWFSSVEESNLFLNGGRLILTDSEIGDNPEAGIVIDNNARFQEFARNSFQDIENFAIVMGSLNASGLDNASEFNDLPVLVRGMTMDGEHSWANIDSYYLMEDITRLQSGELIIEPGATLRFRNDAGIRIDAEGQLTMQGTDDDRILLEGDSDTPGFWRGILVSSTNPNNIIEYAEFAHTASSQWFSTLELAAIAVSGGTLTVQNSIFRDATGLAIFATANSDVTESDNEFNDLDTDILQ